MSPNILRNILRYYRCYHFFILLFVDVKLFLCLLIDLFICCVLIKIQPASFHQRNDTIKTAQE